MEQTDEEIKQTLKQAFKDAKSPDEIDDIFYSFMGADKSTIEHIKECTRMSEIKNPTNDDVAKHLIHCVKYFYERHKDSDGDDISFLVSEWKTLIDYLGTVVK